MCDDVAETGGARTTLCKMIAGASAPDAGSVPARAILLHMGYFAQQSLT